METMSKVEFGTILVNCASMLINCDTIEKLSFVKESLTNTIAENPSWHIKTVLALVLKILDKCKTAEEVEEIQLFLLNLS